MTSGEAHPARSLAPPMHSEVMQCGGPAGPRGPPATSVCLRAGFFFSLCLNLEIGQSEVMQVEHAARCPAQSKCSKHASKHISEESC